MNKLYQKRTEQKCRVELVEHINLFKSISTGTNGNADCTSTIFMFTKDVQSSILEIADAIDLSQFSICLNDYDYEIPDKLLPQLMPMPLALPTSAPKREKALARALTQTTNGMPSYRIYTGNIGYIEYATGMATFESGLVFQGHLFSKIKYDIVHSTYLNQSRAQFLQGSRGHAWEKKIYGFICTNKTMASILDELDHGTNLAIDITKQRADKLATWLDETHAAPLVVLDVPIMNSE